MKNKLLFWMCFLFISFSAISQEELEIILESPPEEIQKKLEAQNEMTSGSVPEFVQGLAFSAVMAESKVWNEGALKVSFKGGTSALHRMIAEVANTWTKHGNITLDFGHNMVTGKFREWVPGDDSHIRVGFEYPGYWSLIGNTSVDWSVVEKGQISLNLFNFDKKLPQDWKATVLHEFGHALGFEHEHQSSTSECDFNWPKLYDVLSKPPNNWTKERVDHNIKQMRSGGLVYTAHDINSIMHYSFPAWMFQEGSQSRCFTSKPNKSISEEDKKMMGDMYPFDRDEYEADRREISDNLNNVFNEANSMIAVPPPADTTDVDEEEIADNTQTSESSSSSESEETRESNETLETVETVETIETVERVSMTIIERTDGTIDTIETRDTIRTVDKSVNKIFEEKSSYFSKPVPENSKFIVGIQGMRIPENDYSKFQKFFYDQNYNINLDENYTERPSWLSYECLVLYYSKSNKTKAQEIANHLTKLTGKEFKIQVGAGHAVFDREKQFYVHYNK